MDKNIPTEEEITDLLSRIQPQPGAGFKQKMAAKPWNQEGRAPFWFGRFPQRAAATFGLILLLVFGISFISPALNTVAERFTHFFSLSPGSLAIVENALLETSHPTARFNLTIPEAEALADFKIKLPATTPQEFLLVGATYDDLREVIILHYTTDSKGLVLRLSQQRIDPDYQAIGPEAVIEKVEIGPYPGEFVAGGWMIPEVESGTDATRSPASSQTVWDAIVKLQTLRWSDGEFLYEIILAGSSEQPGYLDKNGLISLAKHLH